MLFNKKYKDIYKLTRLEIAKYYKESVDSLVDFVNKNCINSFIENKAKMNLKILDLINDVNKLNFDSKKYLSSFKDNVDFLLSDASKASPDLIKHQLSVIDDFNAKTLLAFRDVLNLIKGKLKNNRNDFKILYRKEKENFENEYKVVLDLYRDSIDSVTKGFDKRFAKSIESSRKKINKDLLEKIDILDLSYKREHINKIHLFARRRERMIHEVIYIKEANLSFWKKIGTFIDLLKGNSDWLDRETLIRFEVKINRIVGQWKEQISRTIKHLRLLIFQDNSFIKESISKIVETRNESVKKILSKRPSLIKANIIKNLAEFNKEVQKHSLKDKLEMREKDLKDSSKKNTIKINKRISK